MGYGGYFSERRKESSRRKKGRNDVRERKIGVESVVKKASHFLSFSYSFSFLYILHCHCFVVVLWFMEIGKCGVFSVIQIDE